MLRKNEEAIINLFRKNIFLKLSIRKIALRLKKAYPRVYEAVRELERKNIVKSEKAGNANLVSLTLTGPSISYLSFFDEQEAISKNIPNYEKITSLREISQYLIIVTGSYAKGKVTKNSDLDIILIVSDNQKAIDVQKLVENLTFLFKPEVHLYTFNNKDFIEMLLAKEENYGKEIFRNHIILKNAYIYYEIVREAIEHGFKG